MTINIIMLHIDGLLNTLGCDNLRLIHREAVL